jgi:hypothetical protein
MKIKSIKNRQLTNALHLQFMIEVVVLIVKFNMAAKLGALIDAFRMLVDREDLSQKVVRKSSLSDLKAEKDLERDNLLLGIQDALKSLLRHFDANIRTAANRLKIVFDAYNSPTPMKDLPYDAETVSINNMLQEFEGKYAADVQFTGINGWVDKLKASNNDFDQLAKSYNIEQSEKPAVRTKDARKDTDAAYDKIVTAVNGLIVIEGEDSFAQFVSEINTLIKHYNDLLAQHLGRLNAGNDELKIEN